MCENTIEINLEIQLIPEFNLVMGYIGYAIVRYGMYSGETATATIDAKLDVVSTNDMGWLYFGLFLVRVLQLPLGLAAGVARREAKISPPDQQVYVVKGAEGSRLGYVLMENDGPIGRFNRAQRGYMNYHEYFPTICFHFIAASFVFPKQSCACMVLYGIAAILNAEGYARDVNSRLNGFLFAIPVIATLQGMILFVAHKTLL